MNFRKLKKLIKPHWTDLLPDIISRSKSQYTLQIGSGMSKLEHGINVDINNSTKPDVIHDLESIPYPFKDSTFDMVIAFSIIEHLQDFFAVMGEINRISKDGASVFILVPHFSSAAAYIDPTHKQKLSARSCDYFLSNTEIEKDYGFYVPYRFKLKRRYIELQGVYNYLPPVRWFVQRFPSIWEDYLCYLIRGAGIFWELEVQKADTNRDISK